MASLRRDALRRSDGVERGQQAVRPEAGHDAINNAVKSDGSKDTVDRVHLRFVLGPRLSLSPGLGLGGEPLRPPLGQTLAIVLEKNGQLEFAAGQPEQIGGAEMPGEADVDLVDAERPGGVFRRPAVIVTMPAAITARRSMLER